MTPEDKLRAALEDAEAAFGLLEATLRQGHLEPLAEIVRGFRNKAAAALATVSRETTANQRIENVYCFPNGMVAVTDQFGQQIPEYQGRYEDVWPKIESRLRSWTTVYRSH